MSNFRIEFLNSPWWLMALIPAFAIAFVLHFRIAKKYRRNRNRIISLVLHLVIMTLCIFTLSGIYFAYEETDTKNEVLVLVDLSFSSEHYGEITNDKNEFVRAVIDETNSDYKVGVITFGYNQVYAATMSTDTDEVYRNYLNAELPDDSASDLAGALDYARSLFSDGVIRKIVLISDGEQTDGDAMTAIRMLSANGIQVHTAYFPNDYNHSSEVLISDIILPDYTVSLNEAFTVTATLRARGSGLSGATLSLYDDSTAQGEKMLQEQSIEIVASEQNVDFEITLTEAGMHKLRFHVNSDSDELDYNNDYYSYIYIESFNKILVIEREGGYSDKLVNSLDDECEVTIINISDTESVPKTVDEICEYDEVVLMNIANRDMPDGFIDILYTYVHDIGGGLFTVGGMKDDAYGESPNMYDRDDMYYISDDHMTLPTLYQEMLPVQSINYTPPLGVMIIIDRSGSMSTGLGSGTRLDAAKQGATAAVYSLSERDYCGIMTLDTEFNVEQALIPATQQARLLNTINKIEMGGGTQFAGAIKRAGEALLSLRNVERRHVILISDGEPGDKNGFADYGAAIKANFDSGITFSMVAIGIDQNSNADKNMAAAAELGNGRYYRVWDEGMLKDEMSQELKLPEITEISKEPFQPRIRDHTAVVNGVTQSEIPQLGGYFGTKIKEGAMVPLSGEFVPILAHWRYGEGRVGSFMCDLTGSGWSREFMDSEAGVKIINNTIRALLPTANIRSTGISVEFIEDNYSTRASIFTEMNDGDRLELAVYNVPTGDQAEELLKKYTPTSEEGYTNITFKITTPGVYRIAIVKLDSDGNILAQHNSYRVFSYSEEYFVFVSEEESKGLMSELARIGRGIEVPLDEPWAIFSEDIEPLQSVFDPRWLFIIISIVLFLLDIAVRKFKFKWIHEIVRERRAKRAPAENEESAAE